MGEAYTVSHAASLAVMLPYESRTAYRAREKNEADDGQTLKGEAMSIEEFERTRNEILGGGNG